LVRHSSGIEWGDVKNLWMALEGIHELTVELTVSTRSGCAGGKLATTLIAWVPSVEAHHTTEVAKIDGGWPDGVRPSFASYVFNALYDLDRAIGRAYAQKELPA
jgi:hypothetical protein